MSIQHRLNLVCIQGPQALLEVLIVLLGAVRVGNALVELADFISNSPKL